MTNRRTNKAAVALAWYLFLNESTCEVEIGAQIEALGGLKEAVRRFHEWQANRNNS